MTTTTVETLSVDGLVLNTYAYNFTSWTGREKHPKKVGTNVLIPYRDGQIWRPKTHDQGALTLAMWVSGQDVNGNLPGAGGRATFNDNMRVIKRAFAPRSRLLALERKLLYSTGLETHDALGEVVSSIDHTVVGSTHSTFSVDLVLPDPWWYGPTSVTTFSAGAGSIANTGDVEAMKGTVVFTGPLTNPRLTCTTTGVSVQFAGTLTTGLTVTIDTDLFTALDHLGGSVIGAIAHGGAYSWLVLAPGTNAMVLDRFDGGAVGAGSVTVTFRPPNI